MFIIRLVWWLFGSSKPKKERKKERNQPVSPFLIGELRQKRHKLCQRKLTQLLYLGDSPFCTRSRGLVLNLKVPPHRVQCQTEYPEYMWEGQTTLVRRGGGDLGKFIFFKSAVSFSLSESCSHDWLLESILQVKCTCPAFKTPTSTPLTARWHNHSLTTSIPRSYILHTTVRYNPPTTHSSQPTYTFNSKKEKEKETKED